jgi:hypothetical protein
MSDVTIKSPAGHKMPIGQIPGFRTAAEHGAYGEGYDHGHAAGYLAALKDSQRAIGRMIWELETEDEDKETGT